MASRNAVDFVLNKGIDKQNAANRLNACNAANLGCSLGSSRIHEGLGTQHAPLAGIGTDNKKLNVDNILYDNYNKKGSKSGNEILHSNTVSGGKREINKSNRGVLLRYMKQKAEYINDLDE
jgi:hypothetical protein